MTGVALVTGGSPSAVTCDMRDAAAIEAMVRTVIDRHGRIDILVNNAGGGTSARPMTSDETPAARATGPESTCRRLRTRPDRFVFLLRGLA